MVFNLPLANLGGLPKVGFWECGGILKTDFFVQFLGYCSNF
jgi:hypothetical protein